MPFFRLVLSQRSASVEPWTNFTNSSSPSLHVEQPNRQECTSEASAIPWKAQTASKTGGNQAEIKRLGVCTMSSFVRGETAFGCELRLVRHIDGSRALYRPSRTHQDSVLRVCYVEEEADESPPTIASKCPTEHLHPRLPQTVAVRTPPREVNIVVKVTTYTV